MSDLADRVRDLLFRERMSSTEIAKKLRITPREVMECAVPEKKAETPPPVEGSAQIDHLRRKVRESLIRRLDEFPPASLVRLWQLIEDPKLLLAEEGEDEELFPVSEETWEKIFALLDGEEGEGVSRS